MYEKRITSEQVGKVESIGLGNLFREQARQQQEVARDDLQKANQIYDNEFNTMANESIAQAYARNPNNPAGLQKELVEIKKGISKGIYNKNKQLELGFKFDLKSSPYVDKAQELFREQQQNQLETSILKNIETSKLSMQDYGDNMFSKNIKVANDTSMSFFENITNIEKALNTRDELGNYMFTPEQKQAKMKEIVSSVASASSRTHFDKASVGDKYRIFKDYKSKKLSINQPDPNSPNGFKKVNIDTYLDRTDYEQDVNYMDGWIKRYEAELKEGKKEKEAGISALAKVKAYTDLKSMQNSFGLETKKGKTKATETDDIVSFAEFTNKVYSNLNNKLISEGEAQSFLNSIAEPFVKAVEENELPKEVEFKDNASWWGKLFHTDASKSNFALAMQDLKSFAEVQAKDKGIDENRIKMDMYSAYYNTLNREGYSRENLGKAPAKLIEETSTGLKKKFLQGYYPNIVSLEETPQIVIGNKGKIDIGKSNAKLSGNKISLGAGYRQFNLSDGRVARVKLDKGVVVDARDNKTGKIIKELLGRQI